MLSKDKLIAAFEEIIGWPYVSPGSNDARGIDCSGAFVRAYKLQGSSIYHGSNTIYRKHCTRVGKINTAADLKPGMAVFKCRADGNEPSKYRGDGIGNMYHIGLVVSVSPLRIIHATPPVAKADTALGAWGYWGWLADVKEEEGGENNVEGYKAVVSAKGGVNLRQSKSTASDRLAQIPQGTELMIYSESGQWGYTVYGSQSGYVMLEYLTKQGGDSADTPDVSGDTVAFPRELARRLRDALNGMGDIL